ncbi:MULTISPECIES: universal stress protein [Caballeronia]|uniref:universal stress protein n=1 Tax=Caballeronia TaxID=1827195 RepID=UPI001FD0F352|nr:MULTISPECIES: universal stress protein [Caballeronia]MDR5799210.1 universal stress protein [Caballeronia sp. LZ001]
MFRRIPVGIDGSQIAVSALAEAIRLAAMDGAAIHAVSVVESAPDIVWPGPGFNDPAAHNRTPWGADLMVLGTHGRSGVERILLGSTAESFLRSADIPVLIVPLRNHAESSREIGAVVSPPAV